MAPKIQLQTLPTVAPQQGPGARFNLDARGAFGEQLAGEVQQGAGLLAKYSIEAKQRAAVARVEDAETELERRHQRRLYGGQDATGNAVPGFLSEKGHNALERSAKLLEELQKDQDDVLGTLPDEDTRTAFKRRTDGSVLQKQRQVELYVGGQREVVEGQAFEGRRAAALDAIANGYSQPDVVARERQNMEPLVMAEAKRRGLEGAGEYPPRDGTPAAFLLAAWRRDAARAVLERFLADKDTTRARAFLAQPFGTGAAGIPPVPEGGTPHDLKKPILRNADGSISTEQTVTVEVDGRHLVVPTIVDGKRISAKEAGRRAAAGELAPVGTFGSAKEADAYAYQRHLEEQDLRAEPKARTVQEVLGAEADKYLAKINAVGELDEAYTTAQGMVDNWRDPSSGRVNEDGARGMLEDVPPAKQREVRAMLESLLGHEREAWRRNVDDRWNRAKTAYLESSGGKAGLWRIPGDLVGWLTQNAPDTWRALQAWADQDDRERESSKPTPGQDAAFSEIATLIVDEPGKFLPLTGPQFEAQYLSRVAPRDRRALLGHFLQAKGQAQRPDETLPATVMAEIIELGRGSGNFPKKGDPRTWAPERAAMHAQLVRDLLEVQADAKRHGEQIKPEQWTKEITKRLRPGVVKGGGRFIGDRGGVSELEARVLPDFQGKEWQEEIPDAFRKEAERELQSDPSASFPVTDENIRYLWERQQGLTPPRPATMKPYDRKKLEIESRFRVGTLTP